MAVAIAERSSGTIGLITLGEKCAGARSAGNPHAACDVAGAGNELTEWLVRHSQRKRGANKLARPRPYQLGKIKIMWQCYPIPIQKLFNLVNELPVPSHGRDR